MLNLACYFCGPIWCSNFHQGAAKGFALCYLPTLYQIYLSTIWPLFGGLPRHGSSQLHLFQSLLNLSKVVSRMSGCSHVQKLACT